MGCTNKQRGSKEKDTGLLRNTCPVDGCRAWGHMQWATYCALSGKPEQPPSVFMGLAMAIHTVARGWCGEGF